jgi:hypothetical protein
VDLRFRNKAVNRIEVAMDQGATTAAAISTEPPKGIINGIHEK